MKIGLIFPNKDRRYKTIHLGLAYLAAYAREYHDDLSFSVLDTRVATRKETRKFFSTPFDLVGITVFSPVYYEVIGLFNRVRKVSPHSKICLGGPYVTTIQEDIFKMTPADYAVVGEGEVTFKELIDHLKGEKELKDIDGLLYLDADGRVRTNDPREKISDLDSLPQPAYELFPMHRYPLHRLVTSRGCPYNCAWCNSTSIWNLTYRANSPERMIADVETLVTRYGKKIFVFGDNSFNVNPERINRFCDLLLEGDIRILWSVSLRADIMTPHLARKMKKAGCYNAAIGVESANNEILEKIGKKTTIEQVQEGIRVLKEAGIEIMSQYVIGNPYDTLETVTETINFARQSGCDHTNFYTVLPFRGTPQWDYVEEHGTFFGRDIHDYHTVSPRIVFETPEFPYADRLEAIRMVKKEGFYSNKDTKNWWFDLAKEISRRTLLLLPESTGEKLYRMLKSVYRLRIVKKHNV